jgi:type II secretion system protein H
MRAARTTSGFTLLETLVVLIVMGILVAMTVWRMGPALERGRVRQAAGAIAGDLMFAQAEAARGRSAVVVVLVPGLGTLFVRDRADPTRIYRQRDLSGDSEYALDSLTATPTNMIEILPNGLARQTVTFTAASGPFVRTVLLTRAGQIRVESP